MHISGQLHKLAVLQRTLTRKGNVMKRFLFCIFIMLFHCANITPTKYDNQEYIITHENGEKSFTLYASYFLIKEFCKSCFHAIFIDIDKIKHASIYCCTCNHKSDAQRLWASLFFKFNENQINELKEHIYKDSTKELTLFILQKSQELKLDCRQCGDYNGYYIPENLSKSQN